MTTLQHVQYQASRTKYIGINAIHFKWNNNVTDEEHGNISVLKDMIGIRDGFKYCVMLDIDQVEQIIDVHAVIYCAFYLF